MSTILKFKCPDCGGEKLIMIQGVVKGYPVESILESIGGCCVDTTGEEVDVHTNHVDEIYSYTCAGCGDVLVGDDDMPVTEDKEVVEWVKKNCPQE